MVPACPVDPGVSSPKLNNRNRITAVINGWRFLWDLALMKSRLGFREVFLKPIRVVHLMALIESWQLTDLDLQALNY